MSILPTLNGQISTFIQQALIHLEMKAKCMKNRIIQIIRNSSPGSLRCEQIQMELQAATDESVDLHEVMALLADLADEGLIRLDETLCWCMKNQES